jgi:glycosyltransferase involved in cell wall biosynthesis
MHPRVSGIKYLPFISVCTVTFNRRIFWPAALEMFRAQTYPKNRMEWIIVDDGTDKVRDLIEAAHIPQIKYVSLDTKLPLGAKRNLSHTYCKGDMIVYFDDDDYYPPDRVSHAVETLMSHPEAMCAGASELYVFFRHIQKMYQCGPYKDTHATAGTFAFRRELLATSRYEDAKALAEERGFLKDYTVPFVQLDPQKTILVVSHMHNTFDKKILLGRPDSEYFKESDKTVDDFIKGKNSRAMKAFFMSDIDAQLAAYAPGCHKPDALAQMREIARSLEDGCEKDVYAPIVITIGDSPPRTMTSAEVIDLIQAQHALIRELASGLLRK